MTGQPGFSTLAMHAGAQPDAATGARATPIYQTTAFVFDDVDHAASLFGLQAFGNIYSRIGNPTCAVLEERVAALEGGTAALAVASGHAAEFIIFHTLMQPGDELSRRPSSMAAPSTSSTMPTRISAGTRAAADPDDPAAFEAALSPKTKAIFVELIANPGGVIVDIEAISKIAKKRQCPAHRRQHDGDALSVRAPSSMAPTSSCIRRPSSSAAMATPSAA